MEEGGIEEGSSARSSRWVDGSEVDSESPPWSLEDEAAELGAEHQGTLRRRLVKKPRRVDSLDVEAMVIADAQKHRNKVPQRLRSSCSVASLCRVSIGVLPL